MKQRLYVVTEEGRQIILHESSLKYHPGAVPAGDLTTEQLAQFCDDEAESDNYHHLVGVHAKLVTLIEMYDLDTANRVLREIAEYGGLHCMQHAQLS